MSDACHSARDGGAAGCDNVLHTPSSRIFPPTPYQGVRRSVMSVTDHAKKKKPDQCDMSIHKTDNNETTKVHQQVT